MNWKAITDTDPEFDTLVRPALESREVRKALGLTPRSNGYLWCIVTDDARLAGFGAIKPGRSGSELKHAYVYPEFRGRGLYADLVRARIAMATGWYVKATATAMSEPQLAKWGFRPVGKRGKYTVMRLEL